MKNTLISASMLACDKTNTLKELQRVIDSGIEFIHFDVMDNIFVPNTSFIDDTFKMIRPYSSIPFEIHLMVDNPFDYINQYGDYKEDVIIIHYESFNDKNDLLKCVKDIKNHHRVGISIKPNTNVEVLDEYLSLLDYVLIMSVEPGFGGQKFLTSALSKIAYLAKKQKDYNFLIEVDGGINNETGPLCMNEGCDILVSGSYLFKGDMVKNAEGLR